MTNCTDRLEKYRHKLGNAFRCSCGHMSCPQTSTSGEHTPMFPFAAYEAGLITRLEAYQMMDARFHRAKKAGMIGARRTLQQHLEDWLVYQEARTAKNKASTPPPPK